MADSEYDGSLPTECTFDMVAMVAHVDNELARHVAPIQDDGVLIDSSYRVVVTALKSGYPKDVITIRYEIISNQFGEAHGFDFDAVTDEFVHRVKF